MLMKNCFHNDVIIEFLFIIIYIIYLAEGIFEVLLKKVREMEITQHRILNMLPTSVVHISLTPSQATDVKNDGFNDIMDALCLNIPPYPIALPPQRKVSFRGLLLTGTGYRG
jgi:EamA domain-containing membrane protein RarD